MTINERWRICFEFREGCAYEVEIAARRFILACEVRPQWRPTPRYRPAAHMIRPEREQPYVINSSQHAIRLERGLRTMPKPSLPP
jgi:hypothetical protein